MEKLEVIGNDTEVEIAGISAIPAKIDTGAEFASVWVSQIEMTPDGNLTFCLFAPESPFYTGEKLTVNEFWARNVRNSTGDEEIRYRVKLPLKIAGQRLEADFTLSDRSRNNFPVLIGRQVLAGKFLVDVSLGKEKKSPESAGKSAKKGQEKTSPADAERNQVVETEKSQKTASTGKESRPLDIIGNSALITVAGIMDVPAKIDTGAHSSSIWASDVKLVNGKKLEFRLFAPESPFYTGKKIITNNFRLRRVRNSTGDEEDRYRVVLPIQMGGRNISAKFTLSDRSRGTFPILIGKRTLFGKFLVDVSQLEVPYPEKEGEAELNAELEENPWEFHQKYMNPQL